MDIEGLPGIEETPPSRCPIYRRERHLATAITLTEIEYILEHQGNPAALRPHHKRIIENIKDLKILPASDFLAWCVGNASLLYTDTKEEHELHRRAEKVAHLTIQGSYSHFYKTPPPPLTKRNFPLDTLYAKLAITWNKLISEVAQSTIPRQEIIVGSYTFIFDAELCLILVTPLTCFLVPYSLVLCFADMCSAWFSVDCYASIHDDKYPGYPLLRETRACLQRMMTLLKQVKQKAYTLLKMWPSLVIGAIPYIRRYRALDRVY